MKVVSLVGARPQYVKEAVLNRAFKKAGIEEVIVNSGQHYDYNLSDSFFETLNIDRPKHNLQVGSGKHGEMTAKVITGFEGVLEEEKPDFVLVYGDTNTTLAGAIVAAKMKIPLGHVEAGVRMDIKDMPEEINRRIVDRVSNYLFCPSKLTVRNLKAEGIVDNVHFTGDVIYDLFLHTKNSFKYEIFDSLGVQKNKYVLVTIHRDFNVDSKDNLEIIVGTIRRVNKKMDVVFSMHPRTRARVEEFELGKYLAGVKIIEPCDYLNMMGLLQNCNRVITDSSGLGKEAFFSGKYAAIMMPYNTTPELVSSGHQTLVNIGGFIISESVGGRLSEDGIYGDGHAGDKIVSIIKGAL